MGFQRKINISMLTSIFPRYLGDHRGSFVGYLANGLSEGKSICLRVIAPSGEKSLKYEKWGDLSIHRFNYWFTQNGQAITYNKGPFPDKDNIINVIIQFPIFCLLFFIQILKFRNVTDIFHCQWSATAFFPIIINKLSKKKTPIIITCRGSDLRLPAWFNKFIINNSHAMTYPAPLVAMNEYKDYFDNVAEYAEKHTRVGMYSISDTYGLKNYVYKNRNLESELDLEGKKTLLWVGAFTDMKNPLLAVEAIRELKNYRSDFCLVIIGLGKLENEIKKKINDYKLSDVIKLLGERSDVLEFHSFTDIYISTESVTQLWGATVTEAMFLGSPMILTDVGDTSKIFTDNYDSKLVPIHRPDKIAKTIHDLLDNPEKLNNLSKNAKKTLRKYRRYDRQVMNDLKSLYNSVLKYEK